MKNRFDKLIAVLLAMVLIDTTLVGPVFADGEEPEAAPETIEEIVVEEEPEVADETVEEPVAETPAVEEAPVVEAAPVVEETPVAEEPEAPAFTGSLTASIISAGTLHVGDLVTLTATVKDANGEYSLRWEAGAAGGWKTVENGGEYTFAVSEANAQLAYRAVMTGKDGTEITSNEVTLPEVKAEEVPLGDPTASTEDTPVRLGPDGLTPIFATVPQGTEIKVIAIEGDWVKVELDGEIGYIYKGDLEGLEEEAPEAPAPETAEGDNNKEETAVETEKKVTIFSSRRTVMKTGETVELTSVLEGFEGCEEILYQWECDKGNGFEPVPGATGASYSFEANSESLDWDWQLTVYFR